MMTALVLASNPLTANLERNLAAALASTFPTITNRKLKKVPEIILQISQIVSVQSGCHSITN